MRRLIPLLALLALAGCASSARTGGDGLARVYAAPLEPTVTAVQRALRATRSEVKDSERPSPAAYVLHAQYFDAYARSNARGTPAQFDFVVHVETLDAGTRVRLVMPTASAFAARPDLEFPRAFFTALERERMVRVQ